MTSEEFGRAYERDFNHVIRFFMSRGLSYDNALEYGQAAWVKGLERREQLRDPKRIMPWIISIGLNIRNNNFRRHLRELAAGEAVMPRRQADLAAIQAQQMLHNCSPQSREILSAHYLEGFTLEEIAKDHDISKCAATARLMRARKIAKRDKPDKSAA